MAAAAEKPLGADFSIGEMIYSTDAPGEIQGKVIGYSRTAGQVSYIIELPSGEKATVLKYQARPLMQYSTTETSRLPTRWVTVTSRGHTVFNINDLVTKEEFDRENDRVRKLRQSPATGKAWEEGKPRRLPQTQLSNGEPVPPQYRDLIGFISEALPEYSLAVLPAIEVAAGERKIDAVLKQLKDGVENIQDSSQFRLFLTTMSKFHDYSIGNLILIAIQKPGATHVAGFVTWKDLGRWVKGGERGIAILAPVMPPKPKKEELEVEEEELELTPVYFKVVHIFDISQTEGKPLPEFEVPVLTGEANEELLAKVLALAKSQGLDVSFELRPEQDPSIKGQYFGKTIWVKPDEPRAQQLKSLIHELAHYYSEGVFRIPRRDAETIAESAAFTVGAHYGFDSGVRSFPYVALWAKDKKVLQENLSAVRKVATVILESLEGTQGTSEKLLPALQPFEPYKFCDYVLRNNVFSDKETFVYSGLSGTNPLRVPDHYWAEAFAAMGGEFMKTGDLYVVHTPGVERPPTMRAAPTRQELSLETIELLADTEGDPLRKFCCRQCGECAPKELLEEGKFPERISWLRKHYAEKHPGMWGKVSAATIPEGIPRRLSLEQVLGLETRFPIEKLWADERAYLDKLTTEIEREGLTEPITIRVRDDGSLIVWDGIHRLAVAQKLELKDIPVEFIGNISAFPKGLLSKQPAVIPTEPTGKCYEDAWRFLLKEEEGELVHGSVQSIGKRINHAWVELPTGFVWEPESGEFMKKDYFYERAQPKVEARYTTEEAAIMAMRTKNHGPWTERERKQYLKDKSLAVIPTESIEPVYRSPHDIRGGFLYIKHPTQPSPPSPKEELEFVSDSPEFLAFTIEDIGYREKLDIAFETAIARAKGG